MPCGPSASLTIRGSKPAWRQRFIIQFVRARSRRAVEKQKLKRFVSQLSQCEPSLLGEAMPGGRATTRSTCRTGPTRGPDSFRRPARGQSRGQVGALSTINVVICSRGDISKMVRSTTGNCLRNTRIAGGKNRPPIRGRIAMLSCPASPRLVACAS
jgi:hypothetical protein